MFLELLIIMLLILLDQISKFLTIIHLKGQSPLALIEDVFYLAYVENRGAAFGILQNRQGFFILFTAIFIGVAYYFLLKRVPKTSFYCPLRWVIILFIAGGIGNLIDRIRLGYVVDMFYFKLIEFPVFNVADSYVVVGAILFCVLLLFKYKEEHLTFFSFKKETIKEEGLTDDNMDH